MVSLTTVYIVSILITSIAGIGSAFAGNKMIGGSAPIPEVPLESPPSSIEQTEFRAPAEEQ